MGMEGGPASLVDADAGVAPASSPLRSLEVNSGGDSFQYSFCQALTHLDARSFSSNEATLAPRLLATKMRWMTSLLRCSIVRLMALPPSD